MNLREHVARSWHEGSDHAADGVPFGGPLCNCDQVAGRIIPMLSKAYDEGWFSAVGSAPEDVWVDEWTDGPEQDNPYKTGDSHVDQ